MTMWQPNLLVAGEKRPLYLAIADALAEGINQGELQPGDRLPTHRDLAQSLGVTVGTVSRAYLEAERRGHVTGEVGRGTFVRRREGELLPFGGAPEHQGSLIDLRSNLPAWPESEDPEATLAETLMTIARRPGLSALQGTESIAELPAHQEAGSLWLERCAVPVPPHRVLPVSGAQHGIMVVLASVARPGDLIATMSLTNPGLKAAATLLHCQLEPLAFDAAGIRPESFEQACRERNVKVLYCTPTLHNPTA
ncbi:MAG TPA: PLP-dependent aminotransferase family protein, partial [Symbiobacteriaceae bacterium]|nr:PLP-dependent aminotransferase family protein [Symbiobacteriaceae bacterium]